MSSQSQPNLYIVGFMGTGKSTIGRLAARKLGMRFIDSDKSIEAQAGKSISLIFQEEGEATFRTMERVFIEEGHEESGCLVACGGGLITSPGMLELVRSKGPVISLLASPETIYQRTRSNDDRPLLEDDDPMARIRRLLQEREALYKQAGTEILTDNRSISEVVSHVCRVYKAEARSRK